MVETFNILLSPKQRGFHLITGELMAQMPHLPKNGVLVLLIKHTSAGLSLGENADPYVREDLSSFFDNMVPDGTPYFTHEDEGEDDMPAHVKNVVVGANLTIPIRNGKLDLGIWQGIYLCEFRNDGGARSLSVAVIS